MSLDAAGTSFRVEVSHNVKSETGSDVRSEFTTDVYTRSNSKEEKKKIFLEAMENFANSPAFDELTYQLNNQFEMRVTHQINLVMLSGY
jgi:hypothetical protein